MIKAFITEHCFLYCNDVCLGIDSELCEGSIFQGFLFKFACWIPSCYFQLLEEWLLVLAIRVVGVVSWGGFSEDSVHFEEWKCFCRKLR